MSGRQCKIKFGREEKDASKKVADEGFARVARIDNCYNSFIVTVDSYSDTSPFIAPECNCNDNRDDLLDSYKYLLV